MTSLAILVALGCASDPTTRMGSEPDEIAGGPQVHPAAWGAEHFTFRKKQKVRPANDLQFYFKSCELTGEETFVSKTSYWCNEPW